jgi:hypothetical protein
MQTTQSRRTYDHRIREAILETRDRNLYPELEIPQSTIRGWVHPGQPDVVTSELIACDRVALISENHALRQRTALLAAVIGLLAAMLRVSKNGLDYERYADGASKAVLLRAVDRASKVLPLSSALRVVSLSTSRYWSWRRIEDGCELDDPPSCPRLRPTRLTSQAAEHMRALAESAEHRHMSLRALALHAQRIGRVVASPWTWYRVARKLAWRRPRRRLYPAKPKIGIRASGPGELLHVDITFSNSMIEAFWRSLKHSWLYLHSLESVEPLRSLVGFYVRQHNEVMPHAAFEGQTPDEMYFGSGDPIVVKLAAARIEAREERIRANQAAACGVCSSDRSSGALQLQRSRSRMS